MAKRAGTRPRKTKVAILGTTPSRMSGPIRDPEWDVWTIGPGGADAHPWDRLFEVHGYLDGGIWPEEFKNYLNLLSKAEKPVYTLRPMPQLMQRWKDAHKKSDEDYKKEIEGDFKSNVVLDREHLFEKYNRRWFTSSISYCLALAIEEGYQDIGCWGIDLESGEEYISQHAGAAHFIDCIRLMGRNFHCPSGCGLLRSPNPYPDRYETVFAKTTESKIGWLDHMIGQTEGNMNSTRAQIERINGALNVMRQVLKGINVTEDDIKSAEQELVNQDQQFRKIEAQLYQLRGEKSATEYYRRTFVFNSNDPEYGRPT